MILLLFAYFYSFSFNLVNCDDYELKNLYLDHTLDFNQIKLIFTKSYLNVEYYRPIINLSFFIESVLFDKDVFSSHLFNFILHFFNCVLLFMLLKKLNIDDFLIRIKKVIFFF